MCYVLCTYTYIYTLILSSFGSDINFDVNFLQNMIDIVDNMYSPHNQVAYSTLDAKEEVCKDMLYLLTMGFKIL